jgi:hypothetical protein
MNRPDAANLLARIGVLQSRCDLDLLVFFARHPTALLTSEQLANWLGRELKAIAASLDILLTARLIERTQNPTHAARMYVFRANSGGGGWLPTLLEIAKTRAGRIALIEALSSPSTGSRDTLESNGARNVNGAIRSPALSIVRASDNSDAHDRSNANDRKTRDG